jgi:lyso-ornithine lipid O-acyltransferase
MSYLRILFKTPLFILMSISAYLVLLACDLLQVGRRRKTNAIKWLYGFCMWLLGIRVTLRGTLANGPSLVVANHCSYIDVLLLSCLGELFFTPKSEVKSWPLIGPLIARFNVLFVNRAPGRTKEIQQSLFTLLKSGGRICVFPEATTSDGRRMLPFKSSLFSLAEQWDGAKPLPVQPVTIIYRRVDGKPIDDISWPKVAWYGDIDIVRHLLGFYTHRSVEAEVVVHPPLQLEPGENRKQLCVRAEAAVASALPQGENVA